MPRKVARRPTKKWQPLDLSSAAGFQLSRPSRFNQYKLWISHAALPVSRPSASWFATSTADRPPKESVEFRGIQLVKTSGIRQQVVDRPRARTRRRHPLNPGNPDGDGGGLLPRLPLWRRALERLHRGKFVDTSFQKLCLLKGGEVAANGVAADPEKLRCIARTSPLPVQSHQLLKFVHVGPSIGQ